MKSSCLKSKEKRKSQVTMLIGPSYNMLVSKLLAFLFVVILSSSLGVKGKGSWAGQVKDASSFSECESKTLLMNTVMNLFMHVFRKENPHMIANFLGPGIEFQGST